MAVCCLVVSCDTPSKKAMRALSARGITPSGSEVLRSVERGDSGTLDLLLQAGVYPDQRDTAGRTPLMLAIQGGDLRCALLLIHGGADKNAATPAQVTPLSQAIYQGETALAEILLQAGARPEGLVPGGEKLLPWAIREGRLIALRDLMTSGADPHMRDMAGNPLLHIAMECGRRDLTDELLKLGADPGATNAAGENTLHLAMRRGWRDLISPLIRAGADPNLPDPKGRLPIGLALEKGDRGLFRQLLSLGADPNARNASGETVLQMAFRLGARDELGRLAKAGADLNARDAANRTLLEQAFRSRDYALMEELIHLGADPGAGGWGAWVRQSFKVRDAVACRYFLRKGVDLSGLDARGRTLVEAAVKIRSGSFVRLFLDYGAPPGDALYQTCASGDAGLAKLLLACGVSPNPGRAPYLDTPLGAAIRSGREDVVVALLKAGALPGSPVAEGQPAMHLAIALGYGKAVDALINAGVNPNREFILPVRPEFLRIVKGRQARWVLKNDRNVTPLMLAADSVMPEITARLLSGGARLNVWTRSTHMWPINFASQKGDVKTMRVILGRNPKVEERHILISLTEQRLHMYDITGAEVFTCRVSTGKPGRGTPPGEYVITNKYRTWRSTLYSASMPYFQRLDCGDFGMHQGVVPNYPASHGCIRLPEEAAVRLYGTTVTGDRVSIVP
jgi:ankyrin repeat protein